ncbi:MAG: T9SS type A sorting domain-containing protein [Bacteroidales bacterium]|nr:T9SS type A sorting domain-containing protein [Bacteroidales bacterium]
MRLFVTVFFLCISTVFLAQNFEWTEQSSGVTDALNDVFFTDNLTGWAVGRNGVIVSTTDGGQNWTTQMSGVTDELRAIFFIDSDTGWAVGGSLNRAIIKTTDGGAEWNDVTITTFRATIMYDIAFADANTGWLITGDSIYMSTDGGTTWMKEQYVTAVEGPLAHRSIAVTSDSTAFVAGRRKYIGSSKTAEVFHRRPENAPYLWSYTGTNFFDDTDQLRTIVFVSNDVGFAGGNVGKVYKKTGTSPSGVWGVSLELDPPGNQMINSISFPTSTTGMFNTGVDIDGTSYTLIYHTADEGETWTVTPDSVPDLLLATVHAPDSTNAWLAGLNGKIFKGTPSTVGVSERNPKANISLYPNPTSDFIYIRMNSERQRLIEYTLLDVTGRVIEKGSWDVYSSNSLLKIDLSDMMEGVYFLKLKHNDGQSVFHILKE